MILLLVIVLAQTAAPAADKPMEETKKNIVVLKGVPSSQLIPIMAAMSNSLGVSCAYCHESAWESDAKPAKEAGRRMIRMTRAINDTHYGGKVVVSCNTCHQGGITPAQTPLVEYAGWNKAPSGAAPAQLPDADSLFARYAALIKTTDVRNRASRGIVTARSGRGDPRSAPFELYQEQPGKTEANTELSYPPEGNRELASLFFKGAAMRERYSGVKTAGTEMIRGRNAYVVEATPTGGGLPERLYFDIASGVLLRRHLEIPTLVGLLPAEYDFDDYRTIDGILVPFVMQWSRADYQVTHRFSDVKQNVTPNVKQ